MSLNRWHRLLVALFVVVLLQVPAQALEAPEPPQEYVLGVFPFLPIANLERIFAPLAADLSKQLGKPIKLRLSSSYAKFITELKRGSFDIVHIHPFDYIRFGKNQGYEPLVARSENLFALFSVKIDSPINDIGELQGKVVGTPPVTGSVTYLALDELRKNGLVPDQDVTIENFSNHLACLQQLQIGNIDACATSSSTLKTFESQFGLSLKRLGQSGEIPHTLFAAHERLPAAERATIKKFLLSCQLSYIDENLRELFIESSDAKSGRYFKAVVDQDYDQARLILERLTAP
ncbi:MAG: phosphate/phosphite/phosphonate ABC transporter substrate-binding protein [Desulfuromonadales bacterium]|nr:phosphate/phosphite/phosphonate ABC transporter substrate-binding protein [Desulfuromonadales bacterium]MDW7757840.1 phosphate/phosphite/phosphonate ABC transporter substrate-binding protein [Desulfuromonadales bacterium]